MNLIEHEKKMRINGITSVKQPPYIRKNWYWNPLEIGPEVIYQQNTP